MKQQGNMDGYDHKRLKTSKPRNVDVNYLEGTNGRIAVVSKLV